MALGGSPQVRGTFDNKYRSGVFPIREGSDIEYFLTLNPSAHIIGGGDSGGPDFVLSPSGTLNGILGVHSWRSIDYAIGRKNLPNGNLDWQWTKDIWVCRSDVIHTIRKDILNAISGVPTTKMGPGGVTEPAPFVPTPPNTGGAAQREDGGVARVPYCKIGEKYAKLGGPNSGIGPALGGEADAPYGGRCQAFQHGTICWHPQIGEAFTVWGAIHNKWVQLGRVEFGYPITDERTTSDGRGRYNHFRYMQYPGQPESSIYWSQQTGAFGIHGAIRDAWAQQGWERGPLGYPTSDEHQDGKFRRSNFERGHILWAPDTGSQIVRP